MSRVNRYVVLSTLWIFAYTMHYLVGELLGPGSLMRTMNSGASVGGTTAAEMQTQLFMILSLWIPLGIAFFAIAWTLLQEYRDMRVAGVTGRI